MKQHPFTTTIAAENGKFLTQATKVNIRERVIVKEITLGKNDSPDNWCEISEDEALEFERQLNQAIQDDLALMPE